MSIDEVGTFKASDNDRPVLVFDVNETLLDIDVLTVLIHGSADFGLADVM